MWQIKLHKLKRTERGQPYQPHLRYISSNLLAEPGLGRVQRSRETRLAEVVPKRPFLTKHAKVKMKTHGDSSRLGCFLALSDSNGECVSANHLTSKTARRARHYRGLGLRKPNRIGNVSQRWLGHSKCHLMLRCQSFGTRALCSGTHTKHQLVIGVCPQGSAPMWPSERDLAEGSHPSVKSEGHRAAWRFKTELLQHQFITS